MEEDEPQTNGLRDVVEGLPGFASKEAIKLNDDNNRKEQEVGKVAEEIHSMSDRVKVMKQHFKNVQQEVDHTNALQNAKQSEIQTESHLRQLASRALGRSQAESKKLQSDIEFIQDQMNSIQGQIYKANEKMNEFKMQMNWNQEELEQWAMAAKQKDEDLITLEKYKRADDLKIKELSLQLERLTKEAQEIKSKVDGETTETQAKQLELDRIEQEFKNAHLERQELVNRWQDIIAEMKKRDKEINDIGERFAQAKADRVQREIQTKIQRKRLETQLAENKEVELKSETLSRIVLRKREEMKNATSGLVEFKGELESLKNELTTAAESLSVKRTEIALKQQMLEEKRVQLERGRQKYAITKTKAEAARTSSVKAEMTAKETEEELSRVEGDLEKQLNVVKTLKESALREAQAVHDLKQEETGLRSEISGSRSILRNLEGQLTQLDKEAARQQELLYNAEFQIQQIERKIARGMGERSDEEKVALKKSIAGLEEKLEQCKDRRKMLQSQARKLQNELVALRMKKEDLAQKYGKQTDNLGEKELENKMIEEEIRRDSKELEEMSVLNDLLRLEVRRLRDLLSAKSDAVFSLENRKQQLQLSMEERKEQISVHHDLLHAELKSLQDDKHKLMVDLNNRRANVEKLRSRFESIARSEDEKHSQAYFIIKAAQKREELQRRGDQLDQDIRATEREIRNLYITLDHLNARNIAYRESFRKVDLKGDEMQVLQQLEDRTKLNKDALFRRKKELQRLQTDFDEDSRRLDQVRAQYEKMQKQHDSIFTAKTEIEEVISQQQSQLDDLAQRMQRNIEKHRKKLLDSNAVDPNSLANGTLEEKSAKAEVLKDVVQNVLYTLGKLAKEFPEVGEALVTRLQEADLRLPSKPPAKMAMPPTRGAATKKSASQPTAATPTSTNGNAVQPRTFNIEL